MSKAYRGFGLGWHAVKYTESAETVNRQSAAMEINPALQYNKLHDP